MQFVTDSLHHLIEVLRVFLGALIGVAALFGEESVALWILPALIPVVNYTDETDVAYAS